ncbi:MAG: DUF4349 domain-containing protein [Nitrososphaerales archaeon]|nr:DUF4349 domain-containing protein [Nitrososphaerales archaeon]
MSRFGGVSLKAVAAGLLAFIVIGGFALALLGVNGGGVYSNGAAAPGLYTGSVYNKEFSSVQGALNGVFSFGPLSGLSTSVSTATMTATTEAIPQPPTVVLGGQRSTGSTGPQSQAGGPSGNGSRLVEFFSNVTMESPNPSSLASRVIGLAYSVGGYVAYQSTYSGSSYVIIRVPASTYEQVLSQVQTMGNVTSLTSTSNDVTVQYTNLNATLVSLEAEQQALLRLINVSTTVNDTLAIEARLQSVDAQINFVQSEILQTQRLVTYSTIAVSISKSVQPKPLSMTLSATPKSGVSPLGVTFNAVVNGGSQPYLVNYNFGDGTSQQGQIVIHQFYGAGDYNVTVSATDSTGNVMMASAMVHVSAAPTSVGFGDFPTTLANLLVRVVEGIAEVAVIVLPAAGVLALVILPFRRRSRARNEVKQG